LPLCYVRFQQLTKLSFFVGQNFYGEVNDKIIDSIQEPVIKFKKRNIISINTAENALINETILNKGSTIA